MKQTFYQLVYETPLNSVITSICKYVLGGKIQIPPSGVMTLNTKHDVNVKFKTNQTCHVTKVVYYEGYEGYEYSEYFCELIKKCEIFFDIGANIGYYSIIGAAQNKNLKIYAFDPSPGPFAYLVDNIEINGFSNRIFPFKEAMSDEKGTLEFSVAANPKYSYLKFNSLGGGGHITNVRDSGLTQIVKAKTITLDEFVESHNIKKIDLIKMDAENSEHLIIKGGLETIKKFRPLILTEVFSSQMASLIETAILPYGYKLFLMDNNRPEPMQSLSTLTDEIHNVILVPEEKQHLL